MGRKKKARRAAKEAAKKTIANSFDVVQTAKELQTEFGD